MIKLIFTQKYKILFFFTLQLVIRTTSCRVRNCLTTRAPLRRTSTPNCCYEEKPTQLDKTRDCPSSVWSKALKTRRSRPRPAPSDRDKNCRKRETNASASDEPWGTDIPPIRFIILFYMTYNNETFLEGTANVHIYDSRIPRVYINFRQSIVIATRFQWIVPCK